MTLNKYLAQPLDPDLTAIAALSTSSHGRGLLTGANAAATKTTLGLENVSNTSDANKPVSTATQTALDLLSDQMERIVYDAVLYGVVADGVTDDAPALNALIADIKSGNDSGYLAATPTIRLPMGEIKIASPINLYSGVRIEGHGIATRISPTAGFVGQGLFVLIGGSSDWVQDVDIVNISTTGAQIAVTDKYSLFDCTGVNSTDVITAVGHDFVANQRVWFKTGTLVGGSAIDDGMGYVYYVRDISGDTFKLSTTPGGAAVNLGSDITSASIGSWPLTLLRCKFQNLFMESVDGIVLRNYCQATLFQDIYSGGAVNRMLHFNGNWNVLRRINKEGVTGTSSDPYIKISHIFDGNRSDGNLIDGINIEGLGSANKTPFYFHGVDNLYIQNMWCELQGTPGSVTDGYVMRFEDTFSATIKGAPSFQLDPLDAKIKVDSTLNLKIDQLYLDPTGVSIYDILEISDDSNVTIGTLVSRGNDGAVKCAEAKNLRIQRVYSKNSGLVEGPTTFLETLYTGNNMFTNGSFENLTHGWTIDSGVTVTPTLVNSGVALGKAMQCTIAATGGFTVHQSIVFTAEHVGKPFTFTGAVRTTSPNGYITPYLFDGDGLNLSSNRVSHGRGEWTVISQTFTPLVAGPCQVGVACWDLTLAQLDEFSVVPGTIGTLASSTFRSLEVNGRSITIGAAAPTGGSGTWRVGDMRFNSEPSADEYAGWMCTVAGDPGTWIGFSKLSSSGFLDLAGGTMTGSLMVGANTGGTVELVPVAGGTRIGYMAWHKLGVRQGYLGFDAGTDITVTMESGGSFAIAGGTLKLDAAGITAGAATVSATEVSYLDGVTSAIQGQFTDRQNSLFRSRQSVLTYDDFDRADGSLGSAPNGTAWVITGPGAGTVNITDGSVRCTANTYCFLDHGSVVTQMNFVFSLSVTSGNAVVAHVAAGVDLNNMLHLQVTANGWTLDKRIGGTWATGIASGVHKLVPSHSAIYCMSIKVSGTTVTVIGYDGTETNVTVSDIASMGTLRYVGMQSGLVSSDDGRWYGVSVGPVRPAAVAAFPQKCLSELRGKPNTSLIQRAHSMTLVGVAGWYRIGITSVVGGTFGVMCKIEISANHPVGWCTFGEFAAGGQHDGNLFITKLWSSIRFGGAITSARISRVTGSPYDVCIDVYKAIANDLDVDFRISGLVVEQATATVGATALATETLSITF